MVNVVFYSNCQERGIRFFLTKVIKGARFNHIENYTLIKRKKRIPINVIESADIFIYQPIDSRHGVYSTDKSVANNITTYLKQTCLMISFPYIYCSSLWPIIRPAIIDGFVGEYPGISQYINKEPIVKLLDDGYGVDDIIELYRSGKIDFNYEERHKRCMKILKDKELNCDVKISDFIENNIRHHKLFFTQNHPTTRVFIHCANQIIRILEIDTNLFDPSDFPNNVSKLPGNWPHTSYDKEYWRFTFDMDCSNDEHYIEHVRAICN